MLRRRCMFRSVVWGRPRKGPVELLCTRSIAFLIIGGLPESPPAYRSYGAGVLFRQF